MRLNGILEVFTIVAKWFNRKPDKAEKVVASTEQFCQLKQSNVNVIDSSLLACV